MPGNDIIIQPKDPDHLAKVVRQLDDILDECCMKMEADVNSKLKEIRESHGTLAKAIESAFSHERFQGRFGTGSSAYLKEMCIQRCLSEYADSKE